MRTSIVLACLASITLASKKHFKAQTVSKSPAGKALYRQNKAMASRLSKRANSDKEKEREAKEIEEDTTSDEAFPSIEDAFNACMNDPNCNTFNEHQTDYIPNTGGDSGSSDDTESEAASPSSDCLKSYDAFFYESTDQDCNDEWAAWDNWCLYGDLTDPQEHECTAVNEEFWSLWEHELTYLAMKKQAKMNRKVSNTEAAYPSEECLNMDAYQQQGTSACNSEWWDFNHLCWNEWNVICEDALTETFNNSNGYNVLMGKRAIKDSKKNLRLQSKRGSEDPPETECFTIDAYNYLSDDAYCNEAWYDWDAYCYANWDDECDEAEETMLEIALVEMRAPMPEDHCMTSDAYFYISDDTECNEAWIAWDEFCWLRWTDECDYTEEKVNFDDGEWELLNLAKKAQKNQGQNQFNNGLIIGSSVAAAAALGAIFAMSKCSKNNSIDDFQRA